MNATDGMIPADHFIYLLLSPPPLTTPHPLTTSILFYFCLFFSLFLSRFFCLFVSLHLFVLFHPTEPEARVMSPPSPSQAGHACDGAGTCSHESHKHLHLQWQLRHEESFSSSSSNGSSDGDAKNMRPWWTYIATWRPLSFAWWTSLTFTFGSLLFVIASLVMVVTAHPSLVLVDAMNIVALAGAVVFVVGGVLMVMDTYQAPMVVFNLEVGTTQGEGVFSSELVLRHGGGGGEDLEKGVGASVIPWESKESYQNNNINSNFNTAGNGASTKSHNAMTRTGSSINMMRDSSLSLSAQAREVFWQWRRIDVAMAWIQWFGTLLFLLASVGSSGFFPDTATPTPNEVKYLLVTIVPDLVACFTFVVSGYLQLVRVTHSWYGGVNFWSLGWHCAVLNTLGGFGFLGNGIAYYYSPGSFLSEVLLLAGSVFFLCGSFLSWLEQCQ